jgi:electron transfer flavoprotein alpha subunit
MEKILYLAHTEEDGTLSKPTLEALTAAKRLAESVAADFVGGIVGTGARSAADQVSGSGIGRVLVVEGPEFSQPRYATDSVAIEELASQTEATIVVTAGTSRFSRVLPGTACRVGGQADSHICAFDVEDGEIRVSRWFYRQRLQANLSRSQRPWFLSLDSGNCAAYEGPSGGAEITSIDVALPEPGLKTRVTGTRQPASGEATIRPEADMLFVAGAGWTKNQSDGQQHVEQAETLILAKGLATCCHGEEPHVVGWRFINDRRAINLDPNCGWAQGKADILYIADAFEVMAKVNDLLEEPG